MFCPKCGTQNPETGKFCRSCGTDLGNVSQALTGNLVRPAPILDRKGRPISYESAIVKIFSGLAFVAVAIALSFSIGKGWWFWMLFPAFGSLGAGIAQYFQLKRSEKGNTGFTSVMQPVLTPPPANQTSLPPSQTQYVSPESRYKTGDLAPPSVTDNTTRHLEMDSEGQTMTLPKK
ncbi:MAG: zinc-ribbon domain-containing protein [Acidobacteriota bacterium]